MYHFWPRYCTLKFQFQNCLPGTMGRVGKKNFWAKTLKITPKTTVYNIKTIRLWEIGKLGGTDGGTDGRTDGRTF